MPDPFLDALTAVRTSGLSKSSQDPFAAALADVRATPVETDPRSIVARLIDHLNTPLVPQIAQGARVVASPWAHPDASDSPWWARIKGFVSGATEGAGDVAASFTSPLGLAAGLSGLGGEKAAASGLVNTARALRGVEAATGAAFAERGLEQAADAETIPEAALGVAQAAAGALGVHGGVRGFRRAGAVPPTRPVRGALPPGPRFVVDERGTVAPLGTTIPMERTPDGSYVRSVPGEYPQREVRGALPPGPRGYVAPESGPAIPVEQIAPRDAFSTALAKVRQVPKAADSFVKSVPAAVLERDYEGRRLVPSQYSGDVAATDAPMLDLTPAERHALRWIQADMEEWGYRPNVFKFDARGQGGTPEVIPGRGGAPIYQAIVGDVSGASRGDVHQAITQMLEHGKRTKTGDLALGVARQIAAREPYVVREMTLPPEAGGDLTGTRYTDRMSRAQPPSEADQFFSTVDESAGEPALAGVGREPGEEGRIQPELAARLGLGGAGAAYGAATGDTPEDRVKRLLMFGAAGFAAPSLMKGGGASLAAGARRTLRPGAAVQFTDRSPIPPAGEIPRARLMEFPSLQKQPETVRDEIASLLEQHGGFAKQRRGVQSIERTNALAERLEVPLKQMRPGTALNAEELAAYRDALASVMTDRVPLAEKIRSGAATDADKLQFSRLTDEAVVLVANFRGAKAEAGRALNILRQKARVLDYGDASLIEQAIRAPGFKGDLTRLSDALAAAGDDPHRQVEIFRELAGGTTFQKAQAAYYNSLLSGVKTHLRNTIGNTFNAVANLLTPIGAAPIDRVRSAVTGTPREVMLRELPHGVVATFTAMPNAFRDFAFTVRHGFTPATVDRAAAGFFDAPRVEMPGGLATNWPTRLLEASDVFFRSLAREQELMMHAYTVSRRGKPSGVSMRMADILTGPESSALRQRAEQFAARAVFQESPGSFIDHVLRIKSDPKVPASIRAAATFVTPFIRTPANILRQGLEASPLGFAMPAARQGGREGMQALGRAALGSMALAPIAYLAATGQLSGNGPSDPGERSALLERGWQPNSVKLGSKWIRYQLFQPLSVPMAAIANAYEKFQASDRSDRAAEASLGEALAGAAASLLDQSFFAGLTGLLDAVTDPERNAQQFLATFAQGLVPGSGLLRNVTQSMDPVVRKPEGIAESVKTIVPGLSTSVPARQTRFGEDVIREGGKIRRGFVVPEVSTEKADSVADALARLSITPQVPRARLTRNGQTVPLNREQAQVVVQAIGRERRRRLQQVLPRLANAPEDRQRDVIEGVLADVTRDINRRAIARVSRGVPLTLEALMTTAP